MSPNPPANPEGVRQLRFERPPGSTSVLLIRHGESVPAQEKAPFELVEGQGDPALDPRGQQQAIRIADRLAAATDGLAISAIYVSNLRRTAETAAPLAERLGLVPVVEPRLREVFLGDWEGGLYRIRIREGHPLAQRLLEEERWDVIPGAERDEDLSARIAAAIGDLAAKHPDETIAVFTHGGVIGRTVADASGSRPFAFLSADNGSITHLVVNGSRWVVRSFNDTAHLGRI